MFINELSIIQQYWPAHQLIHLGQEAFMLGLPALVIVLLKTQLDHGWSGSDSDAVFQRILRLFKNFWGYVLLI